MWNSAISKAGTNNTSPILNEIDSLKEEFQAFKKSLLAQPRTVSSSDRQSWYDGVGTPDNSVGIDFDYFLQIDTADIWKKNFGSWERIGNIRGEQGIPGEPGSVGQDGAQGQDGINGQNGIDGQDGRDGLDGRDGATWYDGVGYPPEELGIEGDFYLDVYNGDIYKHLGYWDRIGNLVPSIDHVDDIIAEKLTEVQAQVDSCIEDVNNERLLLRSEVETIYQEYNKLVEEIEPTSEDIQDIIGMIEL